MHTAIPKSAKGVDMASGGKRKTTMAKLARESRLRERRQEKQARKEARKLAAHDPGQPYGEPHAGEESDGTDAELPVHDAEPPARDDVTEPSTDTAGA
jgi:hypothetical protein